MKYAVLVKLRAPGGITVNYPLAPVPSPHYPLPPPTTLVGALAYPFLRLRESKETVEGSFSPAVKILDMVPYASAGTDGWVRTREVERIFQLMYQKKIRWNDMSLAYSVGARGLSRFADDKLYVLYIITEKSLIDYAYGIVRIGKKEGIVSVEDVCYEELEKTVKYKEMGTFETFFYFPKDIAVVQRGQVISMPKLVKENFGTTVSPVMEDYIVNNGFEPIIGELKTNGALIKIEDFEIPIPRMLLEGKT
jgi:CRISPR-associated protein Cas5a/b/c